MDELTQKTNDKVFKIIGQQAVNIATLETRIEILQAENAALKLKLESAEKGEQP